MSIWVDRSKPLYSSDPLLLAVLEYRHAGPPSSRVNYDLGKSNMITLDFMLHKGGCQALNKGQDLYIFEHFGSLIGTGCLGKHQFLI